MKYFILFVFIILHYTSHAQNWSIHTKYKYEWTVFSINGTDTVSDTSGYTISNISNSVVPEVYGEMNIGGKILFKQDDGSSYYLTYRDYYVFVDRKEYYTQERTGRVTYYPSLKKVVRDYPPEWIVIYK